MTFGVGCPVRCGVSVTFRSISVTFSPNRTTIFFTPGLAEGLDDPPDAAVEGWMKSPAHRESLLDPLFTQTGVGIAISPDTEYFITQVFIRPR